MNELPVTVDEYGEVYNSTITFAGLAQAIRDRGSVVIGWTDQKGTHLDILFVNRPIQYGSLQRGMRLTDLFVSVSSIGMHGFEIDDIPLDPGYISEKIRIGGSTDEEFADLINGVRKELYVNT